MERKYIYLVFKNLTLCCLNPRTKTVLLILIRIFVFFPYLITKGLWHADRQTNKHCSFHNIDSNEKYQQLLFVVSPMFKFIYYYEVNWVVFNNLINAIFYKEQLCRFSDMTTIGWGMWGKDRAPDYSGE